MILRFKFKAFDPKDGARARYEGRIRLQVHKLDKYLAIAILAVLAAFAFPTRLCNKTN